ncbi:MAG: molecular chaperone DnaJ [bacterium]|nr:molecular chaperone DnaJ [bacterium]
MKDYYDILGVSKTASDDEIKKAFRKLAHQHHPDKKGGDEAKFKELNEAYQVLSDSQKRAQYDQFGHAAFSQGGAAGSAWGNTGGYGFNTADFDMGDLGDIFGDFFGFGGGRRKEHVAKGEDLAFEMIVDFNDSLFGAKREISVARTVSCGHCQGRGAEPGSPIETCARCQGSGQVMSIHRTLIGNIQTSTKCPDCKGQGRKPKHVCRTCNGPGVLKERSTLEVNIPPGISDGGTLRLGGQGNAGLYGAPAGDIYITIRIRPDKIFARHGNDLVVRVPISFTQAVLGDTITVSAPDGAYEVQIPAGTANGTMFRLRGLGVPYTNRSGRGDLLVHTDIIVPKHISRQQRALLEQLRDEKL